MAMTWGAKSSPPQELKTLSIPSGETFDLREVTLGMISGENLQENHRVFQGFPTKPEGFPTKPLLQRSHVFDQFEVGQG